MKTIFMLLTAAAVFFLFSTILFFYIRSSYRRFCLAEDQKERIEVLKKRILSSREYLRKTYDSPLDHSIPDNIIPKTEFLVKLISHKTPDDQEREYNHLLGVLTETLVRLKDASSDPMFALSPLNSLRDRLVHEHLDYIKDHMEDQLS